MKQKNRKIRKNPFFLKMMKAAVLALTAVYPLFMTAMTGVGLLSNSAPNGSYVTALAVLLLVSGALLTGGAALCIPKNRKLSAASIALTAVGIVLFLIVVSRLAAHADAHGWHGSGKYAYTAVSDMYKARLLPTIFPAALSAVCAAVNLAFFSEDSIDGKSKKNSPKNKKV